MRCRTSIGAALTAGVTQLQAQTPAAAVADEVIERFVPTLCCIFSRAVLKGDPNTGSRATVAIDHGQLGIVSSLNRPDANITGIANLSVEVAPKRIELLRELMPAANTMALLTNPASPVGNVQAQSIHAAAGSRNTVHELHASSESELEPAFSTDAVE